MTPELVGGRKRDVRLHHRVRPLLAVVLAVGAVLLVVALTLGVPWSAVGHGLAQVSVAGWCAIVGSALVGGVGWRFAWTRAWAKAWRDTRWGWIGLVIVVPLMAITALALVLLFASVDTTQASVRIDVIKTALSVGAGAGALAALLLASRKQWSTERSNYDARHDAAERHEGDGPTRVRFLSRAMDRGRLTSATSTSAGTGLVKTVLTRRWGSARSPGVGILGRPIPVLDAEREPAGVAPPAVLVTSQRAGSHGMRHAACEANSPNSRNACWNGPHEVIRHFTASGQLGAMPSSGMAGAAADKSAGAGWCR
jgi:hypothetical protein